ncbi:MAG TPA: ABC transporter substrate-binding protein [Stellaceae bacterium]|nr:ABC transporter substrate-binding protein [Stellaceae bacterium]
MRGLFAGALLLTLVAAASAEEPVRLRIAYAGAPAQMTPILYERPELLKHYGKSYTVEPVAVRGSGPQIIQLAVGELEIGALAPNTFALAIQNAGLADLRIIGDATRDGNGDYFSSEYAVRTNSPIHTIEDLKGKILATNGIGGATDTGLRKLLHDHGLEDKRDLSIVEIEFSNMLAALVGGKIDLGSMTAQTAYEGKKLGQIRVIARMKDAMGPQDSIFWTARASFIAAHRAALVDYFEDTQTALHWFLDPKNRPDAIAILARFTKEKPEDLNGWAFTKDDGYHEPDARPDLDMIQHNIDELRELGQVKQPVDVKAHADLSMLEEAAARRK